MLPQKASFCLRKLFGAVPEGELARSGGGLTNDCVDGLPPPVRLTPASDQSLLWGDSSGLYIPTNHL